MLLNVITKLIQHVNEDAHEHLKMLAHITGGTQY